MFENRLDKPRAERDSTIKIPKPVLIMDQFYPYQRITRLKTMLYAIN
jgi:hypothetical protein